MAYEAAFSSAKKRRFKQVYAASEPGDRDRYRNVRQGIRRRGTFEHSAPVNSDLRSFPCAIPFAAALASPAAKAPSLRFNHLRRRPQPKFVWELHFCPAFCRQSSRSPSAKRGQRIKVSMVQAASAIKEWALGHREHRVLDAIHWPSPSSTRDCNSKRKTQALSTGSPIAPSRVCRGGSSAWHRPLKCVGCEWSNILSGQR